MYSLLLCVDVIWSTHVANIQSYKMLTHLPCFRTYSDFALTWCEDISETSCIPSPFLDSLIF